MLFKFVEIIKSLLINTKNIHSHLSRRFMYREKKYLRHEDIYRCRQNYCQKWYILSLWFLLNFIIFSRIRLSSTANKMKKYKMLFCLCLEVLIMSLSMIFFYCILELFWQCGIYWFQLIISVNITMHELYILHVVKTSFIHRYDVLYHSQFQSKLLLIVVFE